MHFIKFTAKLHFFRERSIMIPLKIVFLHPNKTKDFIKVKILTNSQIKEWDKYTIEKEPISSIDLMERAAQKLTEAIARRWNNQTPIKVFAGPGNNGGDALAVARLLSEKGYHIEAYLFNTTGKLSEDCETNRDLLKMCQQVSFFEITTQFIPPQLSEKDVVIDGLFGSGLNKPLNGGFAAVVKYINQSPATVVAIDIPSGLMCEDNTYNIHDHIVRANLTLTIGQLKLAFLFPENEEILGETEIIDINLHPEYLKEAQTPFHMMEKDEVASLLKKRSRFSHKGTYGHALLIAGKTGMAGASILAAQACLRSGVGLLTIHAPLRNNDILQISVPEAMIDHDYSDDCFTTATEADSFEAVAVGPGIGKEMETAEALIEQLQITSTPMVLDADALSMIERGDDFSYRAILTPHVGEMRRLCMRLCIEEDALSLSEALRAVVIKKASTVEIAANGERYFYLGNNPSLGVAGSGDVLSGIIGAFLSSGMDPLEAAISAVILHQKSGRTAHERLGYYDALDLIEEVGRQR